MVERNLVRASGTRARRLEMKVIRPARASDDHERLVFARNETMCAHHSLSTRLDATQKDVHEDLRELGVRAPRDEYVSRWVFTTPVQRKRALD